ncbi:MAG: hypothetical protein WCC26_17580, partial [Terracidiphilus sp.]
DAVMRLWEFNEGKIAGGVPRGPEAMGSGASTSVFGGKSALDPYRRTHVVRGAIEVETHPRVARRGPQW